MTNITTNKVLEYPKKKISYDINKETLEMLDELTKITHCTRAQLLDTIIFQGMMAQVGVMINTWKEWAKGKGYQDKEKQEKLKKAIGELETFKKKWGFNEFPSLVKESMDKTRKMNSKKR